MLPETVVLSEPWTLTYLNELINNGDFEEKFEREIMVENILKLQLKPFAKVINKIVPWYCITGITEYLYFLACRKDRLRGL